MPAGFLTPAVADALCPLDPEVEMVYQGAEFNEDFGPLALAGLARKRAQARHGRKDARRRRYMRMCRRRMQG